MMGGRERTTPACTAYEVLGPDEEITGGLCASWGCDVEGIVVAAAAVEYALREMASLQERHIEDAIVQSRQY